MICARCGELLLEDRFMNWEARWRCMKCGQVHDTKNVQSHMVNEQNRLWGRSSEPNYSDEEVHLGSESFIGHLTKLKDPKYGQAEGRAGLFNKKG